MKRNKLTTMAALCVAIATFTVTSASALTSIQVQEIKQAVLGVPVPEMPAKAAELVTKAEKKDRQAVAVTAVRAVLQKHRSVAPLVISAVTKADPELAATVAVAASETVNDQAPQIARAAAISAPAKASEVVAAVSHAVPSQASAVAETVSIAQRGSASSQQNPGTVTISDKRVNGQNFFLNPPKAATNGVSIYNAPPGS